MSDPTFDLIFNSEKYPIPFSTRLLNDIPNEIKKSLFFGNHQYIIQSNVSESVFQSFYNYLLNETVPDIQKETLHDFIQINQEFHVLDQFIQPKLQLWGEFLIHINALKDRENEDLSVHEQQIAQQLDFYLENYGEPLMQIPIVHLSNIFNSPNRNLNDHNFAYELIKIHGERSSDFFILLSSLDGSKLTRENLKDSISMSHNRSGFHPKVEGSYLIGTIEKQESLERQLAEISEKSKNEIRALKNELMKNSLKLSVPYIGLDKPGILKCLKDKETNIFDPFFIASASSNDAYNSLNPETNDHFSSGIFGYYFIEFVFEEPINICGFEVFSSNSNFPKSFDIAVDGTKVSSVTDEDQLNGENKKLSLRIEPVNGTVVRVTRTGNSWDESKSIWFKRIEILSSEQKYSNGVFATLFASSKNHDPHRCKVHIKASRFDFNSFYLPNSEYNICTNNSLNSWFQVELTKGLAVIYGFRLKKSSNSKLKGFKIIGTDDANKAIESWPVLLKIDEEREDEHEIYDIYKLPNPSPPIKIIRIINTKESWNGDNNLNIYHFDFYGLYKENVI